MLIEKRIEELGFRLPESGASAAQFVPAKLVLNRLVFTSGCTPRIDGKIAYTGKCGTELPIEEAEKAAELALINCLAAVRGVVGDLDRVESIVKLTGYVNAAPEFYAPPKVIDGASRLLRAIFGEKGTHTRSAVGMASLPGNAACEIELIVSI